MQGIYVRVREPYRQQLIELALAERRHVGDQAALFIEQVLREWESERSARANGV